jgi:dTDP-4-dehydrorhamnose reductase
MNASKVTYVVGASGYVGLAVATRLAADGGSVVGAYNTTASLGARFHYDFWSDDPDQLGNADGVIFSSTVERDDRSLDEFERRVDKLTDACSECRFVYLSSDAVFDGQSGEYAEDAPTNPETQYGRRTARFETLVKEACSDYCIVRPSYVYGYSRGVLDQRLARTFQALRSGKQLTYFDDYFKSPIEVNQLAEIVRRVYVSGFSRTLHAGGPRMSVYQFHRRAAGAFGALTGQIEATEMPSQSTLPPDTSLDSSLLNQEFELQPGAIVDSLTCASIEDVLNG